MPPKDKTLPYSTVVSYVATIGAPLAGAIYLWVYLYQLDFFEKWHTTPEAVGISRATILARTAVISLYALGILGIVIVPIVGALVEWSRLDLSNWTPRVALIWFVLGGILLAMGVLWTVHTAWGGLAIFSAIIIIVSAWKIRQRIRDENPLPAQTIIPPHVHDMWKILRWLVLAGVFLVAAESANYWGQREGGILRGQAVGKNGLTDSSIVYELLGIDLFNARVRWISSGPSPFPDKAQTMKVVYLGTANNLTVLFENATGRTLLVPNNSIVLVRLRYVD